MKRLLVALILVGTTLAAAKKSPGPSLNPVDWTLTGQYGAYIGHPHPLSVMNGWYFQFPADSINYATVSYSGALKGNLSFTIQTAATSGVPIYAPYPEPGNTCPTPATVRAWLLATRTNDNANYGRWWSNPLAYELDSESSFTLSVPLTPDQWTSVFGVRADDNSSALTAFNSTLSKPQQIGLSFGAGCFFGHGVQVQNGTANFILTNVQVG